MTIHALTILIAAPILAGFVVPAGTTLPQGQGASTAAESQSDGTELPYAEPGFCCKALNYSLPPNTAATGCDSNPTATPACNGAAPAVATGATCITGQQDEQCVTEPVYFIDVPVYRCVENFSWSMTAWSLANEPFPRIYSYCSWELAGPVNVLHNTNHCSTKDYLCK